MLESKRGHTPRGISPFKAGEVSLEKPNLKTNTNSRESSKKSKTHETNFALLESNVLKQKYDLKTA